MDTMNAEDARTAVTAATTVVKECLDAGMYSADKCIPALAVFVKLGLAVRTVVGLTDPGAKDPVIEEIGVLKNEVNKIEVKMKENFDDLKAFVSEYSFYNDVPLTGAVLLQYLQDALKNSGDAAKNQSCQDEFKEQFEVTQPMEYTRRLQHQLSKATTNPLRLLIAADPLKGTDTFEKWKEIYESVFMQLFFIECVACKLLYEGNEYRVNMIRHEYNKFKDRADKWNEEYKTDDHYWPDSVRNIVHDIQDNNKEKTSDEKAEMIRQKLEGINTHDIFSIIVFTKQYEHETEVKLGEHYMWSGDRGDCNVIVYRSRRATAEVSNVEKFKRSVEAQSKIRLEYNSSEPFKSKGRLERMSNGLLRDCGFVVIIRDGQYVGFRSTKTHVFRNGPGGHFNGELKPKKVNSKDPSRPIKFFLFSAYK